jgi:Spy/CpxP family protein refolding chaperone
MVNWKVTLATLLIFVSGFVTGGLVTRHRTAQAQAPRSSPSPRSPGGPFNPGDFLKRMEKDLNLTTEQKTRIEAILVASQKRTQPMWDEFGPKLREEMHRTRDAIRAELTPEQQTKFDELRERGRRRDRDGKDRENRDKEGKDGPDKFRQRGEKPEPPPATQPGAFLVPSGEQRKCCAHPKTSAGV